MKKIILLGLLSCTLFALANTKNERKEGAVRRVNNINTTQKNKVILLERLGYYKK